MVGERSPLAAAAGSRVSDLFRACFTDLITISPLNPSTGLCLLLATKYIKTNR